MLRSRRRLDERDLGVRGERCPALFELRSCRVKTQHNVITCNSTMRNMISANIHWEQKSGSALKLERKLIGSYIYIFGFCCKTIWVYSPKQSHYIFGFCCKTIWVYSPKQSHGMATDSVRAINWVTDEIRHTEQNVIPPWLKHDVSTSGC